MIPKEQDALAMMSKRGEHVTLFVVFYVNHLISLQHAVITRSL